MVRVVRAGVAALMVGVASADGLAKDAARVLTVGVDASGVARVGSPPPDQLLTSATPSSGSPASCRFEKVPSPSEAEALVRRLAGEESMDANLVAAVARNESRFRMDQVSPKGAIGLMQLMPATAKRFSVDPCDPEGNVRGGIRYLRVLHDRFRNPLFVLAAYNAGEDAVEQHGGVPPYPETVRYVASVLNDFYDWPKVKSAQAPGRASARRSAAASQDGAEGPASWSQGFVMHVEN